MMKINEMKKIGRMEEVNGNKYWVLNENESERWEEFYNERMGNPETTDEEMEEIETLNNMMVFE